jgi:predicted acyltransferase
MNHRYYSLDVFRGATVVLMILVNNPGSYTHIFSPLQHAKWNGCTPTDLVFPFFLFAVGNALSFTAKRNEKANTFFLLNKIFKRTLLLFLIGVLLNWSPFVRWENEHLVFKAWKDVRTLGVLQRIAICYFIAANIIYFFKQNSVVVLACVILLLYWGLCFSLGDPLQPYSIYGYFGRRIDLAVLGESHLYKGEGILFEPEGLISTMGAIVQVIFGYLTGVYIQKKGTNIELLKNLLLAGILLIVLGLVWNTAFPINKKIWSSSFTVYTTGYAVLIIVILIFLIDIRNKKGLWSNMFYLFGRNPLFIFVLSGILPRFLSLIKIQVGVKNGVSQNTSPLGWIFQNVFQNISYDLRIGSLAYALFFILFYWLIAYLLDKRNIYIKI